MDRGDEWTEVASGHRWRVDRGDEWTEVTSVGCPWKIVPLYIICTNLLFHML